MFYSGSSERLTGNWVVSPDRAVSLRDIVECWLQVHPSTATTSDDKEELEDEQPQCSLLIVSDCPFSGKWIRSKLARESQYQGSFNLQASCGATQCAHEGPEGGLFTQAFVRNAYDSLTTMYKARRWLVGPSQQPASEKLDRMRELFREVALSGEQLPTAMAGAPGLNELLVEVTEFVNGCEEAILPTRVGITSWTESYMWRVSLRPDVPSEALGNSEYCNIL